jgi:hypothetical protein
LDLEGIALNSQLKGAAMSTLDQPILIANSNYHVGHQVAIFVAKEQGYFTQEGLKEYDYDLKNMTMIHRVSFPGRSSAKDWPWRSRIMAWTSPRLSTSKRRSINAL